MRTCGSRAWARPSTKVGCGGLAAMQGTGAAPNSPFSHWALACPAQLSGHTHTHTHMWPQHSVMGTDRAMSSPVGGGAWGESPHSTSRAPTSQGRLDPGPHSSCHLAKSSLASFSSFLKWCGVTRWALGPPLQGSPYLLQVPLPAMAGTVWSLALGVEPGTQQPSKPVHWITWKHPSRVPPALGCQLPLLPLSQSFKS